MEQKGKAVIVSAPSGAGKTTLVRHLLSAMPRLAFSVSACSRSAREGEIHGHDYYFLSVSDFLSTIRSNGFVEWQEVYPGSYYGTLKSELDRIWAEGNIPIFDVDVVGALNLKEYFGKNGLALFIQPPSLEELEHRLRKRASDSEESIARRLAKSTFELTFADRFDTIIVNDNLEEKCREIVDIVSRFLSNEA
jgi:guanylate kinase